MKRANYFWSLTGILLLISCNCFAGEKDLRPLFEKLGIGLYNQGARGTCSVFAVTGVVEFEYANTFGKVAPLSVEYLNWASNQISGVTEDGSYFSDAVSALRKYGICTNDLFPYYIQNYSNKISPSVAALKDARHRREVLPVWIKDWDAKTGMNERQIEEVKNQILNEHPVAIGFRWPKNDVRYRTIVNGIMTVPPEEGVFDGHSIIIVGFRDDADISGGGYFIFKNSYGKDYSENGYGKMPYEYLQKYANDGVAIHLKK